MGASNSTMCRKLQGAINRKFDQHILLNRTQWYSIEQDRPVTVYTVRRAVWDEKASRNKNIELFKSTSQIQVVLFLRDMWYELNGWEVPVTTPEWKAAKENYFANKNLENGGD